MVIAGAAAIGGWAVLASDRLAAALASLAAIDVLPLVGAGLFGAAAFTYSRAVGRRADAAEMRAETESAVAAELRDFLEAAPDATVVADADGRIVRVNAQTERVFGYRRDELVGQRVEMLLPERARALHRSHRAYFAEDPKVRPMGGTGDLIGLRRNGEEFPVEVSLSPVGPAESGLVAAAIRDVTIRVQREADLAHAEAASEAKTAFLSQMSHELRTPLNAIIGFAQILEMNVDDTLTDRQADYARIILSSGHTLLELINDILDIANIETGHISLSMEAVMLADVLARVEDIMTPLAEGKGVRLTIAPTNKLPPVLADDLRTRQVLLNLMSNAIKYNVDDGAVEVSAEEASDGRIRITVRDTGPGIPPERQEELFQPFSRLGAETKGIDGVGIGLALAKNLVEAMGGAIGFESTVGKGSTFWIDLAIAPKDARAATADLDAGDITPGEDGMTHTLLYVEDNVSNLRLMEHLIATVPNLTLLSAPTPRLGLELARAHRPDVIVLDLHLPEMNGFDLFERLKAAPETRRTPVIALTAAAMPRDVRRGVAAGFFRYMTKPLEAKGFLEAVDEALRLQDDPPRRRANGNNRA